MWCWILFLTFTVVNSSVGSYLKCGEDIVIGRGQKKTLKFWSDDDDLKVKVMPSDDLSYFNPNLKKRVTYNQIPGLSQAIQDHNQYHSRFTGVNNYLSENGKNPTEGLHYSGNPELNLAYSSNLSSNATSVEDDEEISNSEVIESSTTIYEMETQPSTTTSTVATTTTSEESIKLVTFIPNLVQHSEQVTNGSTASSNVVSTSPKNNTAGPIIDLLQDSNQLIDIPAENVSMTASTNSSDPPPGRTTTQSYVELDTVTEETILETAESNHEVHSEHVELTTESDLESINSEQTTTLLPEQILSEKVGEKSSNVSLKQNADDDDDNEYFTTVVPAVASILSVEKIIVPIPKNNTNVITTEQQSTDIKNNLKENQSNETANEELISVEEQNVDSVNDVEKIMNTLVFDNRTKQESQPNDDKVIIDDFLNTFLDTERQDQETTTINIDEEYGFKGFDYYETLYDSLMTQMQKNQNLDIDELVYDKNELANETSETATRGAELETTTLPVNQEEYEDTKASIPILSIVSENVSNVNVNDVEQQRAPPAKDVTTTHNPEISKDIPIVKKHQISNNTDWVSSTELLIDESNIGEATTTPVSELTTGSSSGDYMDPDFEETKDNIPMEAPSDSKSDAVNVEEIVQLRDGSADAVENKVEDDNTNSQTISSHGSDKVILVDPSVDYDATKASIPHGNENINDDFSQKRVPTADLPFDMEIKEELSPQHVKVDEIITVDSDSQIQDSDKVILIDPSVDYDATKASIPHGNENINDDFSQKRVPTADLPFDMEIKDEPSPQHVKVDEIITVDSDSQIQDSSMSLKPSYTLTVSNEIFPRDEFVIDSGDENSKVEDDKIMVEESANDDNDNNETMMTEPTTNDNTESKILEQTNNNNDARLPESTKNNESEPTTSDSTKNNDTNNLPTKEEVTKTNATKVTVEDLVKNNNTETIISEPLQEDITVNNTIFDSITSIIKDTINTAAQNAKIVENATTDAIHIENMNSSDFIQDTMDEEESFNNYNNEENLLHIPLEIIVNDSPSSSEKISIAVPLSALETEEALDEYLDSKFPSSVSHVVIREHGSKVTVSNSNEKSPDNFDEYHNAVVGNSGIQTLNKPDNNQIKTITNKTENVTEVVIVTADNIEENDILLTTEATTVLIDVLEDDVTTDSTTLKTTTDRISSRESVESSLTSNTETTADIDQSGMAVTSGKDTDIIEPSKNTNTGSSFGSTVIGILEQMLFNSQSLIGNQQASEKKDEIPKESITDTEMETTTEKYIPYPQYVENDFQAYGDYPLDDVQERVPYPYPYDRPPARKDDSAHFGEDPPFFIKLPGSQNAVPLYIQYEPVQVKYVPVETREGNLQIHQTEEDKLNPEEFSRRTGIEEQLNAIESDLLINRTAIPITKVMDDEINIPMRPEGTMVPSNNETYTIGSVQSVNIEDVRNPAEETKEISSDDHDINEHNLVNLQSDFYPANVEEKDNPDPFVVMSPPDLTSQEVNGIPYDDISYVENHFSDANHPNYQYDFNEVKNEVITDSNIDNAPALSDGVQNEHYSSEHLGTIYGDVDLENLHNPVFNLHNKPHSPSMEDIKNPAFTPFPITTNPPRRTTSMENEVASIETTTVMQTRGSPKATSTIANGITHSQQPEQTSPRNEDILNNDLYNDNIIEDQKTGQSSTSYQEPPSIEYSPIPASDFRISYNPSDMPKFLKENPSAFPSWYPKASDEEENTIRAAALTSSNPSLSGKIKDSGILSEEYSKFQGEESEGGTTRPVGTSQDVHEPKVTIPENDLLEEDSGKYGAFYHPADIPGMFLSDITERHLSLSERPRKAPIRMEMPWYKENKTITEENTQLLRENPSVGLLLGPEFFQYLNNLPEPILRDFLDPSLSERAVRVKRSEPREGEQIYCEWNIKTDPGLYLLITFQNLSAPYSVDCHGAYIEVERENNGYDARWCGNRGAYTGTRPHVIFAKSEVRITVYDDGRGKKASTGFEADIDVIDLFNPREYSAFMESSNYPQIRRLLKG